MFVCAVCAILLCGMNSLALISLCISGKLSIMILLICSADIVKNWCEKENCSSIWLGSPFNRMCCSGVDNWCIASTGEVECIVDLSCHTTMPKLQPCTSCRQQY